MPADGSPFVSMRSLSIVLCTCNGARFLEEQMASLCAQEDVDEILVVDDHSTDDTMAILHAFADVDHRIRLHWNERSLGVTANFERALRLARGDWLALADQDDVWLPEKTRRLIDAWDGRSGLIHHASRKFHGALPSRLRSPAGGRRKFFGSDVRRLLYRNSITSHAAMIRADLARRLMPFPSDVPHDWWLGIGAAAFSRVQYVDEYLVHYRIHDRNTYHRRNSKRSRLNAENHQRLALLEAAAKQLDLSQPDLDFVQAYRRRLYQARTSLFSWRLWALYWSCAPLLFFGSGERISSPIAIRKSLQATWQASRAGRTGVSGFAVEKPVPQPMRRERRWLPVLGAAAMCATMLLLIAWLQPGAVPLKKASHEPEPVALSAGSASSPDHQRLSLHAAVESSPLERVALGESSVMPPHAQHPRPFHPRHFHFAGVEPLVPSRPWFRGGDSGLRVASLVPDGTPLLEKRSREWQHFMNPPFSEMTPGGGWLGRHHGANLQTVFFHRQHRFI
jgi:glycosyltransferase involved in cell wall biosynthesis